jgi:hypothetical protein
MRCLRGPLRQLIVVVHIVSSVGWWAVLGVVVVCAVWGPPVLVVLLCRVVLLPLCMASGVAVGSGLLLALSSPWWRAGWVWVKVCLTTVVVGVGTWVVWWPPVWVVVWWARVLCVGVLLVVVCVSVVKPTWGAHARAHARHRV